MIQTDSGSVGAMPTRGRQRLKKELREQRVAMDLRYRNRTLFLRERGVEPEGGLGRIIVAMENAERDNFDDDTLLAVENVYDWQHGSIHDVLAGRPPRPKRPLNISSELHDYEAEREEIRRLVDQLPIQLLPRVRGYLDRLAVGD